ncbi:hypothetical protein [Amycolatopsis sp. CA-230715]|uniref:hypothetical protein n=1 Tax=Amycolatopsis sp. CA-230715 TaxID=2745196 RepID=UPI001C035353|nr:hypothetical protein [Amycolatopsis sp. CA-230715]QWF81032.1 hypothetical protein HUW46_04457 [Amycolatopsis sp. CA-230715]
MSLSTTHDFYLGRGLTAEWLGSVYLDSCACDSLDEIERARTADGFRILVDFFLHAAEIDEAGEVTRPGFLGWPWPWPTSHGTDYVHAFDAGVVWTALRGDRWSVRAGEYVAPGPEEIPLVFLERRDTCGYTGIDAADTTARRYGPLLGDTHRHDLHQLGLRILTDLTAPRGPGTPHALDTVRAQLSPHLRYAIAADESAVELEFEVFGYRDGDPAAEATAHALSMLPALYGWTDPAGGPPRFGVRVLVADDERHTTHPVLVDHRARAVLTAH